MAFEPKLIELWQVEVGSCYMVDFISAACLIFSEVIFQLILAHKISTESYEVEEYHV